MIYRNAFLNADRKLEPCKLAYQKPLGTVQRTIVNRLVSPAAVKRSSVIFLSILVEDQSDHLHITLIGELASCSIVKMEPCSANS